VCNVRHISDSPGVPLRRVHIRPATSPAGTTHFLPFVAVAMPAVPFGPKPYRKLGRILTTCGRLEPCAAESSNGHSMPAAAHQDRTRSSSSTADYAMEIESTAVAVVPQSRMRSTLIELVGSIAGACTTAAFLPQVYTVYTTGKTDGLSLPMYCIFVAGVFMWIM
jgi:hypothetical protein